jgi:aspartyl/asparaginyl beta-hydroxylase (cupin superfamily)
MDYHPFKSKVNHYFARYAGGDRRSVFFDIDEVCPGLHEVTRAYPVIRAECERLLDRRVPMPMYHELDAGEYDISAVINPDRKWTVFMLYILGYKPRMNRALCPETCRVLDRIPNLVQAFFSILEPEKSVPRHEGPYLGYLRYHLGLRVPRENPPRLIVHSHEYVWKEGDAVMFDDTWDHEVVNQSKDIRAVLIVDVLRPMPVLPSLVNRLVTSAIMRPTYGRALARKTEHRFSRH